MNSKLWYQSKTLWFNVIVLVMGAVSYISDQHLLVQYGTWLGLVTVLGNMILRMITGQPIGGGPGNSGRAGLGLVFVLLAASCLMFLFSGCAGTPANKAVTTVEITNASVNTVAAALEKMCQDGTIKAADCQRIQTAYDRLKAADDSAVHVMAACIQAGQDPKTSPDYQAALAEATKAMQDLFTLAEQFGVLKGGGAGK